MEVPGLHRHSDMTPGLMARSPCHPLTRSGDGADHSSNLDPVWGALGALWNLLGGDIQTLLGMEPALPVSLGGDRAQQGQGLLISGHLQSDEPLQAPPGLPEPLPNHGPRCFWPASAPGKALTLPLKKSCLSPACLPSCLHPGRVLWHKAGQVPPPWRGQGRSQGVRDVEHPSPWKQAARLCVGVWQTVGRGAAMCSSILGGHSLAWDIPLGGGGSLVKRVPSLLPVCRTEMGVVAYKSPPRSVPISAPPPGEAGAPAARGRGALKALRGR